MKGTRLHAALLGARKRHASRESDRELLRRFVEERDESAFAALVYRHGPMVLGTCRRVLHNHHDAEDAWQAAFLLLAAKAASLRWERSVATWLYVVARNVARKAKNAAARRSTHERRTAARRSEGADIQPGGDLTAQELRAMLDEELGRLPQKYRSPLVLCYLEGLTRDEAARQLGWPLGTLKSRVERGRELLADRLTRRGLTLSAALPAALLTENILTAAWPAAGSAGVPAPLVSSTVKAASSSAAGQAAAAGVVSAKVAALTEGVLKMTLFTKLRVTCAALFAAAALGTGFGLLAFGGEAGDEKGAPRREPPKPATRAAEGTKEPAPAPGRKPLELAL
jgi:RNA polymerase sigma factor (sigma-70 family)